MSARARLWLDLALFGALFIAYNPAWTRIAIHEWLSVLVIVPLLFHVIINWDQTLRDPEPVRRDRPGDAQGQPGRGRGPVRRRRDRDAERPAHLPVRRESGRPDDRADVRCGSARTAGRPTPPSLLLLVHFALHWRWIVKAAGKLGRPPRVTADDPILAIRMATRRLERSPRGEQYATAPATDDARYRP